MKKLLHSVMQTLKSQQQPHASLPGLAPGSSAVKPNERNCLSHAAVDAFSSRVRRHHPPSPEFHFRHRLSLLSVDPQPSRLTLHWRCRVVWRPFHPLLVCIIPLPPWSQARIRHNQSVQSPFWERHILGAGGDLRCLGVSGSSWQDLCEVG